MRRLAVPLGLLGATAAVGAAGLGYAAGYEVRAFRLRTFDVPVLPAGAEPIKVLHVSDLHLVPSQRRKRDWVRGLAELEPDLVVDTGDNLAHPEAVPAVLDAFEPLLHLPGVFVLGSNDYYAPKPRNWTRYLLGKAQPIAEQAPRLPTHELVRGLTDAGWADLTNARATRRVGGRTLEFVGVDDPHLGWDRYDDVAGPPSPGADLTIGVAHAPYRRTLDAMVGDGFPLVLAGHTHGGQLCVPGFGALVTNCDLPRQMASGLSRWREPLGLEAWLHVSAGLGTSPYAPVRFACHPEATLLTLVPATGG
ncbi:putative MPP superfamily phosphohydrolase [Kineococcus xinjiangensis]|uniref:Putative MPP superfamily phosphohydrolase n=1 Tax=Kineococcus xinjiangensis TaxID=512762 RepID=A0A2S6IF55_9ACTN|nr:metallophosphoesterase [Kineococcus xinjiangensis]PPK92852.1 putative MPP superfamily phosphohydrolase [Kineococcus xinjiangensis]